MQKTVAEKTLNTSLELFPLEAVKMAPIAKGRTENLKKEYFSIDDIEKLTEK